ncbi:MAG: hypothetical protein Q7S33_01235 [Nanoarchaeota archaeon]|nr:hypothetical protein [Nanoarchaeota archaeon]
MVFEYFTGIEFNSRSGEYKSNPTSSASEAFEVARIGNAKKYSQVTLYVKKDEKIVGIPYSELNHLENSGVHLEEKLRELAEEKFN